MHGEDPTRGLRARARAERTPNMTYMVLTLDVSKFSGWLNDVARCQIEGTAYTMRSEVRAGRRKGLRWWRWKRHAWEESPSQGWGPRARVERT